MHYLHQHAWAYRPCPNLMSRTKPKHITGFQGRGKQCWPHKIRSRTLEMDLSWRGACTSRSELDSKAQPISYGSLTLPGVQLLACMLGKNSLTEPGRHAHVLDHARKPTVKQLLHLPICVDASCSMPTQTLHMQQYLDILQARMQ